ncbi:MAG: hypothetical protein ACRC3Y_13550 [Romboutsia sp.]|uniref:hypothetical protein n=1 Tax=Romboutsia sp. TaxID=1965302 RepID=UPI003F2B549D
MKVTVLGSHLCPDTLYALCKLRERNIEVDFKDLSSSLGALKKYISYRQSLDIYKEIRESGGIGIPLLTLEDGTQTLSLDEVLNK